jgi:CubicO group peptidase (beta-lactamase class C family)
MSLCATATSRAGLTLTAAVLATVSAASAQAPADLQAAIEGPQAEPGAAGLGSLTMAELLERLGVPGVSVAVVRDFSVDWAKGYGVADVETGHPVDPATLFQAASISKPVAAMAVLRAVEDGLFTLDDDVDAILTSWTLDGAGFTERVPVTPRGLTSHTSGLGDGFGFPGYEPDQPRPTVVQILSGGPPSNVGPVFMEREPGSFYEYSGGGVTLMQLALTDARRRPFHEILRDDVLAPVGMTRSTFAQPLTPEQDANAARAHGREGESMGAKWHVYPELAAAGLWTTPTDLARFAIEVQRASRGDPGRAISRASAGEMLSPVGVGPFAVGFTIDRRGEGWYFTHGGSNWGFRALLIAHKTKGYGLVVMTNASRGGELADEILRRVERAYEWDSVAEPVRRGSAPQ